MKCEYRLLNPCSHCLPIRVIMYARAGARLGNSGRRKTSNSVSSWHGAPWFSTFRSSVTRLDAGMKHASVPILKLRELRRRFSRCSQNYVCVAFILCREIYCARISRFHHAIDSLRENEQCVIRNSLNHPLAVGMTWRADMAWRFSVLFTRLLNCWQKTWLISKNTGNNLRATRSF